MCGELKLESRNFFSNYTVISTLFGNKGTITNSSTSSTVNAFPGSLVPVLTSVSESEGLVKDYRFGKQVLGREIYNARCETIDEKDMFRNLSRGIIVAESFKEKHGNFISGSFTRDGNRGVLGIGSLVGEKETFIVTTDSIKPVSNYHHRMPLVIPVKHWINWLNNEQVEPSRQLLVAA